MNPQTCRHITSLIEHKALALDGADSALPKILATDNPQETIRRLVLLAAESTRYAASLYDEIEEHGRQVLVGRAMICNEANHNQMAHCGDCSRDEGQERAAASIVRCYLLASQLEGATVSVNIGGR